MKCPLHILHLEDDANDAELIQSVLKAEGIRCAVTRVESRTDFVGALERGGIDLILSDFALPAFDGLSAAKIVRTRGSMIPLIFVSGSLDGELAISSFKSGATDCVAKKDLTRLAPAVRRAMREVDERAEHRALEAQFIEAQKLEVIAQLSSGVGAAGWEALRAKRYDLLITDNFMPKVIDGEKSSKCQRKRSGAQHTGKLTELSMGVRVERQILQSWKK